MIEGYKIIHPIINYSDTFITIKCECGDEVCIEIDDDGSTCNCGKEYLARSMIYIKEESK